MKIAIITNSFGKSTLEATKLTTLQLAKYFNSKNNKVRVIGEKTKELSEYEVMDSVKIYRKAIFPDRLILFRRFNQLISAPKTINYAEKKEKITFDVIHNISASPLHAIRLIFSKFNSSTIKIHTIKSLSKSKIGYLATPLLNITDAVIVNNEVIGKKLIRKGLKKSKLKLIRSPIDLKRFKPYRKTTKIPIIFFYGPFTERKGIIYLIKAIPLVIQKNPKVKFILSVKFDTYDERYDQLIKKLNVEENVKIITTKEKINLPKYISNAIAVVLPYPNLIATESNPLSIFESMACNTSVITSDLPELRAILKNRETALLAKPKSPKSIAKNILLLLKDKKLQERLKRNGRKLSKEFDLEHIAEKHLKLYKSISK